MVSVTELGVLLQQRSLPTRVISPFLQQRRRLLEVGRVKALREPAIDRGQKLARFGLLALLLPEAGEAPTRTGPRLRPCTPQRGKLSTHTG